VKNSVSCRYIRRVRPAHPAHLLLSLVMKNDRLAPVAEAIAKPAQQLS
jgi:hypothetical protein